LKNIHADLLNNIRSGEHTDLLQIIQTFWRKYRSSESMRTFWRTYEPSGGPMNVLEDIKISFTRHYTFYFVLLMQTTPTVMCRE